MTGMLCGLGQVTSPLWASLFPHLENGRKQEKLFRSHTGSTQPGAWPPPLLHAWGHYDDNLGKPNWLLATRKKGQRGTG